MNNAIALIISSLAVAIFSLLSTTAAFAVDHIPVNYQTIVYDQGDGVSTTVWYAKIPAKYKMHYAYGNDKIFNDLEEPSKTAARHNATVAINTQFMGLVEKPDGTVLYRGASVAGYDFSSAGGIEEWTTSPTNTMSQGLKLKAVAADSSEAGVDLKDVVKPLWGGTHMCFARLVIDGVRSFTDESEYASSPNKNLVTLATIKHPRTFIAIDSNGDQYGAVTSGRKFKDDAASTARGYTVYKDGFTYDEIVTFTREKLTNDIQFLYNLDGGGSSSFVYKGKMINDKLDGNGTTERQVRGIFYWKAPKVIADGEAETGGSAGAGGVPETGGSAGEAGNSGSGGSSGVAGTGGGVSNDASADLPNAEDDITNSNGGCSCQTHKRSNGPNLWILAVLFAAVVMRRKG